MKNSIAMAFLVVAFIAGAVVFAGLYFAVVFGTLSYLDGASFNDRFATVLGRQVAAVAGPLGIAVGVGLALGLGWDWFKRADGGPDWAARILGIVLGVPPVLIWIYLFALPGLEAVGRYKALGFLATIGFIGMAGWVHKALSSRN